MRYAHCVKEETTDQWLIDNKCQPRDMSRFNLDNTKFITLSQNKIVNVNDDNVTWCNVPKHRAVERISKHPKWQDNTVFIPREHTVEEITAYKQKTELREQVRKRKR